MKKIFIAFFILINFSYAGGQNVKPLSIGQRLPENVWNMIPKKKTTKIVVLDFWATSCSSCISAFPMMTALQQNYNDNLQIVLVNVTESEKKVEEEFIKINKARTLTNQIILPPVPKIYNNALLGKLFPRIYIPHHVWLDGNGKVLAITQANNTIPENLEPALQGKSVNLPIKDDKLSMDLNNKGFIGLRYKTKIPAYYSSLMPFDPDAGRSDIFKLKDTAAQTFKVTMRGTDVAYLYYNAYQYSQRRRIIMEVSNKEMFNAEKNSQAWREKYLFSYELQIPLSEESNWRNLMQEDLNRFLGSQLNIKGAIEKRKMKCLILIKSNENSLRSKGGEEANSTSDSEIVMTNEPFEYLISNLNDMTSLEDMSLQRPLIDETAIDKDFKIDIKITGDLKNIQNVKSQLQNYGLDIIEGERKIEVLVIKDKK